MKTTYEEFEKSAEMNDIVPVFAESLADLETPVTVLNRFSADENVFLLESVEGGENVGRYSFLGINPRGIFTVEKGKAFYTENYVKRELPFEGAPINALRGLVGGMKVAETQGLPPLFGGAVGFLSYEAVAMFEELPSPRTPTAVPECAFMIVDEMIAFDNRNHTIKVIINIRPAEYKTLKEAYTDAVLRADAIVERLRIPCRIKPEPQSARELPKLKSNMEKQEYCNMVSKAREYIRQGEVIQTVLSQKFSSPLTSSPLQLYRALRYINPSPYTFYLKLGETILVGSSPETMVKLEKGKSSLKPIAGTRKRGGTPASDMALADELLKDEKERAEHLMLVDLGRNDLGRTALPGTVQVKSYMNIGRYSHVMHLVSNVESMLDPKYDAFDLLKTTFPAGTLSGAPKIRAMELIHELEPEARGVYGGSVGYISYNGDMDMAITIRTLEIRNGELHIQAGAGIVYDSVPEQEYEETLNKAGALFKAVKLASDNFEL